MGSTLFRDPQARSSALTTLGTLQPRVFGSLNHVDPLDLVSNYYIANAAAKRLSSISMSKSLSIFSFSLFTDAMVTKLLGLGYGHTAKLERVRHII